MILTRKDLEEALKVYPETSVLHGFITNFLETYDSLVARGRPPRFRVGQLVRHDGDLAWINAARSVNRPDVKYDLVVADGRLLRVSVSEEALHPLTDKDLGK